MVVGLSHFPSRRSLALPPVDSLERDHGVQRPLSGINFLLSPVPIYLVVGWLSPRREEPPARSDLLNITPPTTCRGDGRLISGAWRAVQRPINSPRYDTAGIRSQTTLTDTRIGTDNNAPGTPHSQTQNINETKMATGLSVKRRPSRVGVTKFASRRWSTRYHRGGRSPRQGESKVRGPPASRAGPTSGPSPSSATARRRRVSCGRRRCSPATTGCPDRKSTRLNSSHLGISYAVFCL